VAARLSLLAFALVGSLAWTPRSAGSPATKSPSREPSRALVTLTTESDDFAGTVVTLDPSNAYDNVYTVHYFVTVTINGSSSQYGGATLVIGIETNDGSGWVERAAQ